MCFSCQRRPPHKSRGAPARFESETDSEDEPKSKNRKARFSKKESVEEDVVVDSSEGEESVEEDVVVDASDNDSENDEQNEKEAN